MQDMNNSPVLSLLPSSRRRSWTKTWKRATTILLQDARVIQVGWPFCCRSCSVSAFICSSVQTHLPHVVVSWRAIAVVLHENSVIVFCELLFTASHYTHLFDALRHSTPSFSLFTSESCIGRAPFMHSAMYILFAHRQYVAFLHR